MKNTSMFINGFEHKLFEPALRFNLRQTRMQSQMFYDFMNQRRSVRSFSDKTVERDVIKALIMTASTAPSGANKQPWFFCAVSDKRIKADIRKAAEEVEKRNYQERMSHQWKSDLAKLATDYNKSFLEEAPWLIVAFKTNYDIGKEGEKLPNYYVNESVGLACGFLISAIHHAGLITVPYTPSPMQFLSHILQRPANERPYMVFPVGYPSDEAMVPLIKRKPIVEVAAFYE